MAITKKAAIEEEPARESTEEAPARDELAEAESAAVAQMLVDHPEVNNDEIEAALTAGLTRRDIEWNQRLARPWLFKADDEKAEVETRQEWFVNNGIDADTAKEYVAAGH